MNSFGPYNLQVPLYDPREVWENRARFRRDSIKLLGRANSFYCPAGRWPCRGWILLAREDYDKLDKYSTELQLNISDTTKADNVDTLKLLSVVQAQCVTRGLASDKNALYLVEVTDGRGILCNEWFQFPTTSSYNIRVPAYPSTDRGGTFYTNSMNTGVSPTTTWTWSTMLKDLWDQMGTFLGAFPGLPSAPHGTPEGFWFSGVPAWTALCDVLEYLGMTVACDLTKALPYTIVTQDAADAAFTALENKYAPPEDDLEWIDTGAARVPKTIKVLFRRRNSVYGTEETVTYRNDIMAEQWSMESIYTVSVNAPVKFASAVGTHYLWSDFTIRYDDSSNPSDADITWANTIANERVRQYFDRIVGFMSKTYGGALPFATGSQVEGVCWSHDYSNQDWQVWKTQIVRCGGVQPWPEIYSRDEYR